uniref:Uncharacterized protein n=1 Tax=Globisporangium ultimum (strain ATCC 200006 / CBS 805.95 / DAOM BR144) TaxID=431595 RepID=K3WJS0_GLOUD
MESLRMLEILQLYRQVYCNPATRSRRPLEKSASSITLLAFP